MRCNPHYSDSVELSEVRVLVLLGDRPWNEVTGRPQTPLQLLSDRLCADLAFKADLYGAKNVRQSVVGCCFCERAHQNEYLMGGSVGQ